MVIIHRGIKVSKRKNSCGNYLITVEDTSLDSYSPIRNAILMKGLIEYADRQKEACRAIADHTNMA